MTPQLKSIIANAQTLSPREQVELIVAVSQLLKNAYYPISGGNDFWQPKTLQQVLATQEVPPFGQVTEKGSSFWPKEETVDHFIHFINSERAKDTQSQ